MILIHRQQRLHQSQSSSSTTPPHYLHRPRLHQIDLEQNDPMVITIEVTNFAVRKVLINQGSFAHILYMSTFRHLQVSEFEIRPYHDQLVRFSGERVDTCGYIDLLTTFEDPACSA
ncbi:hypothetical protein CR513_62861, partial [Mucuna pruriens]